MSDVISMREKIRGQHEVVYVGTREREMAYQEGLKAEMPEMKPLREGHSKGDQIIGVLASIFWPVVAGISMGGIVGAIIGGFLCIFPVGAVILLFAGDVGAAVELIIHIIGVIITYQIMVSNRRTQKMNAKIQKENDEKMYHYNEELQKISRLKAESNKRITQERQRTQEAADAQIAQYNADVEAFCQQALGNSSIEPMVARTTEMFKRMISHQESGADVKYIEADFNYQVGNLGITYVYESEYSNPESNFDFKKERFHELSRTEECEGLAKALSVLVIARMKEEYPSDLTTIKVSNEDASFNLHFKTANENFEAAKDIF